MRVAGAQSPSPTATAEGDTGPTARARRRDSLENADKVLTAAIEVCTERGLSVALPEVAARAGVGRATVYRSFGSREELIDAVMNVKINSLRELIAELVQGRDAWVALGRVLDIMMEAVRTDRLLADACVLRRDLLRPSPDAASALDRLVSRAQEQGAVREGVTGADVLLLVGGLAHALTVRGEQDLRIFQRATSLVTHAIKADTLAL
jgi:AcrR family transcriptional regulator